MKKILFPIVLLTGLNFSLQAQTNMMATANANPDFELFDAVAGTVTSWSRSNGSISTLTSVTSTFQSGARCFEANVTGTPASQSTVQISNNKNSAPAVSGYYALTAGVSYTLRYWAKADVAGKKINALMQTSTFATPTVTSGNMYGVTLTDVWKQYTVVFSSSAGGSFRPAFQFGYAIGVYHLDNIELFETSSVPVELVDFQAKSKNKTVALDWQVAQELGLKDYTIERSTDGKTFANIGVRVAKNTPLSINYSFEDENPAQGVNYYHLKINEEDGTFKYSKIQSAQIGSKNEVSIVPNPTTGLIQLKNADTFESIEIFNLNGQLMRSFSIIQKLDVSDLAKGVYQVRIKANGKVSISQLVKM